MLHHTFTSATQVSLCKFSQVEVGDHLKRKQTKQHPHTWISVAAGRRKQATTTPVVGPGKEGHHQQWMPTMNEESWTSPSRSTRQANEETTIRTRTRGHARTNRPRSGRRRHDERGGSSEGECSCSRAHRSLILLPLSFINSRFQRSFRASRLLSMHGHSLLSLSSFLPAVNLTWRFAVNLSFFILKICCWGFGVMPEESREMVVVRGVPSIPQWVMHDCRAGHDILALSAPVHRFVACWAWADPKPRELDVSFGGGRA